MTNTITTTDLEQQGFTQQQIERLEALRAVYPIIEMVDSSEQLQRLVFLKWLHSNRANVPEDSFVPAA